MDIYLGIIGILLCSTMVILLVGHGRKYRQKPSYLIYVFMEGICFFLYLLIPYKILWLKLILSFCSILYGMPALYLFVKNSLQGDTESRSLIFLPFLINLPLGIFFALGFAQQWLSSWLVSFYVLLILAAQTLQLAWLGRRIFRLYQGSQVDMTWLKRVAFIVLFCYGLSLLFGWFFFFLDEYEAVIQRPVLDHFQLSQFLYSAIVLAVWSLSLAVLWSLERKKQNLEGVKRYQGRPVAKDLLIEVLKLAETHLDSLTNLDGQAINPRRLAEEIDRPYYLLSKAVNDEKKLSVSALIHQYRIKRAKRLLTDQPEMTIIEIAYESGFQAKSTFNSIFKSIVGMTPKEFRQRAADKGLNT